MKASTTGFIFTFVAATLDIEHAFCPPPSGMGTRGALLATVDDAAAKAMSDYMAKSHEEKLRAIKEVENKKNAEIDALKAEIQQLKSNQASTGGMIASSPALSTIPTDSAEIAQKLVSYQNFMSEYIVNAQNQKLLAIREAELKAEKKFQERLEKLLSASKALLQDSSVDATILREPTLFEKRNARIIASANAGVSRWGSMEVDRASEQAKHAPVANESTPSNSQDAAEVSLFDKRNAKIVAAANAGKSRWGSMEVQRAKSSGVSNSSHAFQRSLFDLRNAKVIAAASAGKSRWGSMEVERAKRNGITVLNVPSTVSVPVKRSLEDRVNLGARLLGA
ncbi:hypothetical protein HJC23_005604 [Cyclotella cryptica]|uniref:Uncharacterized protein n=1 Tax=Cyclotella cryptica TaxID=29204 RepID=A0ABD3PZC0_9STRA